MIGTVEPHVDIEIVRSLIDDLAGLILLELKLEYSFVRAVIANEVLFWSSEREYCRLKSLSDDLVVGIALLGKNIQWVDTCVQKPHELDCRDVIDLVLVAQHDNVVFAAIVNIVLDSIGVKSEAIQGDYLIVTKHIGLIGIT